MQPLKRKAISFCIYSMTSRPASSFAGHVEEKKKTVILFLCHFCGIETRTSCCFPPHKRHSMFFTGQRQLTSKLTSGLSVVLIRIKPK